MHPFQKIVFKQQTGVCRQAAERAPQIVEKTGQRFYFDFGLLRASTKGYTHLDPKTDLVIESHDDYNSYLAVVDEHSCFAWVFLTKSKDPPIQEMADHLNIFGIEEDVVIRCDQDSELTRSQKFITTMKRDHEVVKPICLDSSSQNGAVEQWNGTYSVTVGAILYTISLLNIYLSTTLLHVAFLHNRRVHSWIKKTEYEGWYGMKPNLRLLRLFGLQVSVKRSGDKRAKFDKYDFTRIFLGYTATDQNVRYIDVMSAVVKSSHHVVFNEDWHLHPVRPPGAQLLYDLGITAYNITRTLLRQCLLHHNNVRPIHLTHGRLRCTAEFRAGNAGPITLLTRPTQHIVNLRTATVQSDPYVGTCLHSFNKDRAAVDSYGITQRDMAQVCMALYPYNVAFQEDLPLLKWDQSRYATAGLKFDV